MSQPNLEVTRDDHTLNIKLSGAVSVSDIIDVITTEYPALDGRSLLWDFRDCDVAALDPAQFGKIAAAAFTTIDHGKTRKTAYVVASQAAFVKACKYLNEASALRMPIEYSVFTSFDEANAWLRKK